MSGPILFTSRLLLTLVLYVFLGWALWVLWQDLRRHSRSPASSQIPAIILVLQSDGEETLLRFDKPEILVGRDIACACQLDDRTVSAQHARLIIRTGSLDDSGSMCAALVKARRAGVGPDLKGVIDHWSDYIAHEQFRIADGTLARQRPQPDRSGPTTST